LLPAMGYGASQMSDLQATVAAAECDVVAIGTPIDLARVIELSKPTIRVRYEFAVRRGPSLEEVLAPLVEWARQGSGD